MADPDRAFPGVLKEGNYSEPLFSYVKNSGNGRKIREIATPVCALVRNDAATE